ncbi:MAG: hypothetical protein VX228_00910 [Pseudomonadota bacterium]|nr:hypothetical protein [Pseudomonadota bacterium]
MKPSFALSLSFEGIDLLHRADDGWRAVGRVAFEDEDLGAALTGLREQALLLSPEGITSKLILPEDQIKYVSVPVGKAPAAEHESLAHAAIEGTTPYALTDLAIDWQLNGPVLEVAAVARETLAEAEAFAHEHQFNPVSFVAQPAGAYPGEPFFGGTHAATELFGGRVEPDEDAVAVIGPAKFPAPPAPEPEVSEPVPEPEVIAAPALETIAPPAIDAAPAEVALEAPQPMVTPAPVAEQPAPPIPEPTPAPAPEPIEAITAPAVEVIDQPVDYAQMAASIEDELSPAIPLTPEELELIEAAEARGNVEGPEDTAEIPRDLEELQHDLFAAPQAEAAAEPALPDPEDILAVDAAATADETVEDPTAALPPMFGSSRAKAAQIETPAGEATAKAEANSALSFASVRARRGATDEDTGKAAPRLDGASRTSPEVNGVRKLTLRPDKAAATPAETATDEAGTGAPALDVDVNAPTVPPISDEAAPAVNGAAPSGDDISEDAEAQLLVAAASLTPTIVETEIPPAPVEADVPEAEVEVPAPGKAPSRRAKRQQEARKEKQQMTVFGARKSEQEFVVGGKPRFLGLILTALLLLFLVGMAAWASLGEEGIAGLFRSSDPATTAEVLQAEAEQEAAPAEDLAAATAPETTPAPAADQPVATLAPQEAETPLAEVDLPAVEGTAVEAAPDTSEVASLSPELQYEPEAPATPDAATSALTDPALVEGDEALTALDPELQAEPEITETAPAPELSTAERYAVSGVWQDAPSQPSAPATAGLDDLYVASIDPAVPSFDAVALPDEARVQSDTTPPQQNSPAAAGTEFTFDQRGLVTASPEGTLTPDGILIFSGRPPVLPNSFPARTVVAPEGISEAELLRRSKIRPKARPEDLIESNERSVLGGRTRTELAQLRPKARPDNLRTAANSNTDDGDRLALLNSASAPLVDLSGETRDAINEAVAQSVGATSLRPMARPSNLNTSNTESVQVAAAVRVQPQLPTSASVARQATVKNQLNLKKINLIGVSGQPSNRSALVRLASGRYKKVNVGDRLDGGRVASISEGELRYTKSGRTITLKMPRG